ncbi:hypothetical protein C8R47DRAFT_1192177 [Mycena vitilis]|nr:hypothetical protein C8R47DRAFT_1192177 [Mycena vitilis]
MKREPSTSPDPIAALAKAMADAQDAIAATRTEKDRAHAALALSQQQCQELKAEILQLEMLADQQADQQQREMHAVRERSDRLATERDIHHQHAEARAHRISSLQERITFLESSRRGERANLDHERMELEESQTKLKAGEAALKDDRTRFKREQAKFSKDKKTARSDLAAMKESVDNLVSQFADEDEEGDRDGPDASPRKRKRG